MKATPRLRTSIKLLLCLLPFTAQAAVVDQIVAVVNNEAITQHDVTREMRKVKGVKRAKGFEHLGALTEQEALDELINDRLMNQAMMQSKIVVNEEDINRSLRNVMAQNGMTSIDQLRGAAAREGLSFEEYRENLKRHIQQMKFVNQEVGSQVKITDQDLEDYYRQHMQKFSGTGAVHIAQIIFPLDPKMTEGDARQLQATVQDVSKKLNKGNFKQMARKYSKGPNADQGGDMGVIDPATMQPEVAKVILPMQVGEISKPIVTANSINIVMVLDRGAATDKDFARLKDQIYNILYDQRMQSAMRSYVAQLRQKSYVEIKK